MKFLSIALCSTLAFASVSLADPTGPVPALDKLAGHYTNFFNPGVYPVVKPMPTPSFPTGGGVSEVGGPAYFLHLLQNDAQNGYALSFGGGSNRSLCEGSLQRINTQHLGGFPVRWGQHGALRFTPYRIIPSEKCGFIAWDIIPGFGETQYRRHFQNADLAILSTVEDATNGRVYGFVQIFHKLGPNGGIGGVWLSDTQFVGHPDEREPAKK